MAWLTTYLTSSIGRKLTMSLTGLFMVLFLVVHLIGNFQLLHNDNGEAFNRYTYFMTHFPLIKMISYGLYLFIIVHTIQGLMLWSANRKAKGQTYAVKTRPPGVTWASGNMALLGTLILAFLIIHMAQFWGQMHFGDMPENTVYAGFNEGKGVKDLYSLVAEAFTSPLMIGIYIIGQVVLAFHLWHGFQSAFQTLGVNHPKYTPFIKVFGKAFSILIPLGFAAIPIIFYLKNA